MKIGEKTFVALSYQLKVDGEVVETVTAESPLRFVYGTGFLLPAFEKQLVGLEPGGGFAFRLEPAEAYGDVVADAVVELPKEVFMIEGKIEDGLLEVGNQLPMSDNQGNRLVGVVKAVGEDDGLQSSDGRQGARVYGAGRRGARGYARGYDDGPPSRGRLRLLRRRLWRRLRRWLRPRSQGWLRLRLLSFGMPVSAGRPA